MFTETNKVTQDMIVFLMRLFPLPVWGAKIGRRACRRLESSALKAFEGLAGVGTRSPCAQKRKCNVTFLVLLLLQFALILGFPLSHLYGFIGTRHTVLLMLLALSYIFQAQILYFLVCIHFVIPFTHCVKMIHWVMRISLRLKSVCLFCNFGGHKSWWISFQI